MLINCDIGERGVAHPVDDKLMTLIDIANIACGGHAGDKKSVEYYIDLAKKNNVKITAHLSYPDRENFGRQVLQIPFKELLESLDEQYALMPDIKSVKLHGALYNEANVNEKLAITLLKWLEVNHIEEILTPKNSLLNQLQSNLSVLPEAFLDRTYIIKDDLLQLSPRSLPNAVITDARIAIEQLENIQKGKLLEKYIDAKTLCIHSDNPNALEILESIQNV